ncbi:MAG TPA: hypothetical protein VNZ85_09610 [Caulobacter sp.]|nr:hypothetical protein [Caulobacter sp.]
MLLFQAALPGEKALWTPILDELVLASQPVLSWRQRRNFQGLIQLLLDRDPRLAAHVAGNVCEVALRGSAEKAVRTGAVSPRPFFWHDRQA